MVNIYVPAFLTVLLFILFIAYAKLTESDISESYVELFLSSFGLATSSLLSISLIFYALKEEVILGLSNEMLHLGIFLGGVSLLINSLNGIHSKMKTKSDNSEKN